MSSRLRINLLLGLALLAVGCQSGAISDERKAELSRSWDLYRIGDPNWPQVRDAWYAQGGAERELLVTLLMADMIERAAMPVKSPSGDNLEPGWRPAQRQLLALGSETTVEYLIEAMRAGKDNVSQEALADTLAGFGAVDEVIAALDAPRPEDSKLFRQWAVVALIRCGGQRSIDRVALMLRNDPDWQIRSLSAEYLTQARYSDRDRAAQALAGALNGGEEDDFVIKQILKAMTELDRPRSAVPIAMFLESSSQQGQTERSELAILALQRITRQKVPGNDPLRWKAAAERAASEER